VETVTATSTATGALSIAFDSIANEAKISAIVIALAAPVAVNDADGDGLADAVDPFPSDPFNGGWSLKASSNGTVSFEPPRS